ncbi:TFIIIC subunit 6 family protein ASCRUDRAFT_12606 [Ascoidea rubescens DSM 1968]|uniref:Transcription factor TFIIIC triple barrel domain-containing protein n=1 Tax=Ascoidea rubescens DSM 1968 TaxID=1344418 RepID=A0A1D2VM06_9ASCO|nr:hypothetical protein ASCRUDRAFT_12606 [Ascoidea rubescens DSM 1968]ODV62597.1 hypothetical protein ASCRUDRAFT_12606 [Ascoidea rubescens DSM 1968]
MNSIGIEESSDSSDGFDSEMEDVYITVEVPLISESLITTSFETFHPGSRPVLNQSQNHNRSSYSKYVSSQSENLKKKIPTKRDTRNRKNSTDKNNDYNDSNNDDEDENDNEIGDNEIEDEIDNDNDIDNEKLNSKTLPPINSISNNLEYPFNFIKPTSVLQISGLETEHPLFKIDDNFFRGSWENLVGTEVFVNDNGENVLPNGGVKSRIKLQFGSFKKKKKIYGKSEHKNGESNKDKSVKSGHSNHKKKTNDDDDEDYEEENQNDDRIDKSGINHEKSVKSLARVNLYENALNLAEKLEKEDMIQHKKDNK